MILLCRDLNTCRLLLLSHGRLIQLVVLSFRVGLVSTGTDDSPTGTKGLQVSDQFLFLSEHRLQAVELGLQLLYGQLSAALRSCRVL